MTIQEIIQHFVKNHCLSSRERKQEFQKLLEMDFDPEIHFPMAYLYLHYVDIESCEKLLAKAFQKTDMTWIHLNDFCQAMKVANFGTSYFPLNVPYSNWWQGPHFQFPPSFNDKPFLSWNPAKVTYVEKSKVEFYCAKPNDDTGWVTIDKEKLNSDCEFPERNYEDYPLYVELAFYASNFNDKEADIIVKSHNLTDWNQPYELECLHKIIQPVIDSIQDSVKEFTESFYKKDE